MPQFDILIVGAGLVGLSTAIALRKKGHNVRILESTSSLQIIGDSIVVGANQQRVLRHLGILDDFHKIASKDLGFMYHRRYDTGEVISVRDMKALESTYGYGSYIISRPGYQDFLYKHAVKLGTVVQFDSRVESVDDRSTRPAVILRNGSRVDADIIVGADGVKSAVREIVYPGAKIDTEWNCYRAIVPHQKVKEIPDFADHTNGIHFNMGPHHLAIIATMSDTGDVVLNLHHPGNTGTAGSWEAPGNIQYMRDSFKDFYPKIQALLGLVDECIVWRVVEVAPLPSWVSRNGKVVLIGDSVHAMTPHQGQGCSTGVEDGAVLAECLDYAKSIDNVPALLKEYEALRKPRAEMIQANARLIGRMWMLPDGEQQQARDERMRKTPMYESGEWDGQPVDDLPSGLADPNYNPWLMGHDAVEYARRKLSSVN